MGQDIGGYGCYGEDIYGYFSTSELDDPALVDALCSLDAPLRLFAPGARPEVRARLDAQAHIVVEDAAISSDLIARRSRLMLHSAQHGILCLGLGCGLPHVAFPQHLEHEFHGRRAEAHGVLRRAARGLDAAGVRALILDSAGDEAMRLRARQVAGEARAVLLADGRRIFRERLNRVMTGGAGT